MRSADAHRRPTSRRSTTPTRTSTSLRQALLDLATYRLPEWTDRSPADLGDAARRPVRLRGRRRLLLPGPDRQRVVPAHRGRAPQRPHLLRLIGYELAPPRRADRRARRSCSTRRRRASRPWSRSRRVPSSRTTSASRRRADRSSTSAPTRRVDLAGPEVTTGADGTLVLRRPARPARPRGSPASPRLLDRRAQPGVPARCAARSIARHARRRGRRGRRPGRRGTGATNLLYHVDADGRRS